ncbi:MAG: GerMN domain-containing protein [Bacteroidales bacterium]|nr:GerMN domain-containing protein [Bacteroidales bacterium]
MAEQVKSEYIKNEAPPLTGGERGKKPKKSKSVQKIRRQANAAPRHLGIVFWPVFFILICGLFMLNRESIGRTLERTQFLERLAGRSGTESGPAVKVIPDFPAAPENGGQAFSAPQAQEGAARRDPPRSSAAEPPTQTAPADERSDAEAESEGQAGNAGTQTAAAKPPTAETLPSPPAKPEPARDRSLYYIQIDRGDGTILSIKVLRKLPASDSPMFDALEALLSGPSEEERGRGLMSLIPGNVKILDARVLGTTAYINFNEDFQYNQYGAEGYIAQLRQIIWTATEFSTVEDVQFLIEGRRVDYLGESIWIGSPLSRESFQ